MCSSIDRVRDIKLLHVLRLEHFVEMKDALIYALEYEATMLVNRQQRHDDISDVIIALEDFFKKYQRKHKISKTDLPKCLFLWEGGSF